jgi:predicted RNase H-like HicB family nuclease
MTAPLTTFIKREGDGYVSFCPEIDVASQGDTVQEASDNLREAVELFFETASPEEISHRGFQIDLFSSAKVTAKSNL